MYGLADLWYHENVDFATRWQNGAIFVYFSAYSAKNPAGSP
ncbi:hypothetical protein SUBVAR_04648 [Subdoligranulum variabile DSM 15176]|uniref:Uncharacterized protein n=1 Tax=Subdoligranulum variabile DSM 15176 TaxID=411471 RepID=D1PJS8_9FIRM|nr:hypothetical protein SUBVAR_04648 [Subdoligranulum variabile DSM 15176]